MPALHVNPAPLVYCSALVELLHEGIEKALGTELDEVAFATTVFAAIAPRPLRLMPPHAGALEGPVDKMTWPLVDPAGLRS
jgi:hypothetical protein